MSSTPEIQPPPEVRHEPPKKRISMAVINFFLDAALFVSLVSVMWVSVLMQVIFPPPTLAAGWTLWGLTYDQWRNVQFGALCVCAGLAIEHLVLHWNWVCSVLATQVLKLKSRPDEGNQAVYGVGVFITVMLIFMASLLTALFTVSGPDR